MASQITACQRRKQFITPFKGAILYWLFILLCSLRNDAGASGSFFPSFFPDFALLFCRSIADVSYFPHGAVRGLGLAPGAARALSPLSLPMPSGSSEAELPLTPKSICEEQQRSRAGQALKAISRAALPAPLRERWGSIAWGSCCFHLGLPSAAKLKYGSALAFCLQDFGKFG